MSEQQKITEYYNELATEYDQDRFSNSYGQYLHAQEIQLLSTWLAPFNKTEILDLGCGTGRFLDLANFGVDISPKMLSVAKKKYPQHQLMEGSIDKIPLASKSLATVFSMHVIMHLDTELIRKGLEEVHRVLKPGGLFIFDFPNRRRRKLINYQESGWHGNTAFDLNDIQELMGPEWKMEKTSGFLLFPIHRIPKKLRPFFRAVDSLLCQTYLKHLASYYCVALRKKDS